MLDGGIEGGETSVFRAPEKKGQGLLRVKGAPFFSLSLSLSLHFGFQSFKEIPRATKASLMMAARVFHKV